MQNINQGSHLLYFFLETCIKLIIQTIIRLLFRQFVYFLSDFLEVCSDFLFVGVLSHPQQFLVFLRLQCSQNIYDSQLIGLLAQIDVGTGPSGVALMLLPGVVIGLPAVLQEIKPVRRLEVRSD